MIFVIVGLHYCTITCQFCILSKSYQICCNFCVASTKSHIRNLRFRKRVTKCFGANQPSGRNWKLPFWHFKFQKWICRTQFWFFQPTDGKMTILSSDNGLLNGDVKFFFGLHFDCNNLAFDEVFLGIAEVVLWFLWFLDISCHNDKSTFWKARLRVPKRNFRFLDAWERRHFVVHF